MNIDAAGSSVDVDAFTISTTSCDLDLCPLTFDTQNSIIQYCRSSVGAIEFNKPNQFYQNCSSCSSDIVVIDLN